MLNLSDKELDRLAREAANEYDPGNPAGPGSWDRMQLRLDNELGSYRPNFFRSIRRMPFYYAPAILLVVGVSYFLMRSSRAHPRAAPPTAPAIAKTENSGSPPMRGAPVTVSPSVPAGGRSIKNQNDNYRSTSTHHKEIRSSNEAPIGSAGTVSPQAAASGQPEPSASASATTAGHSGYLNSPIDALSLSRHGGHRQNDNPAITTASQDIASSDGAHTANGIAATHTASSGATSSSGTAATSSGFPATSSGLPAISSGAAPAGPLFSVVRAPQPTRRPQPVIDDSGLRMLGTKTAATAAVPVNPAKKNAASMHIDRPLSLGFSLAPDFASVNSLAGDKPGSTIGITVGYQFFNRLHIQTGFLLAHKNYTAAEDDYHVPYDYYRMNNMHDVSFVKGTLNLYEIPLDLRYDFSIAGNTTFFVSGGMSSYLLTHENCNYYFDLFGRTADQEFKYNAHQGNLFATVDLSMGVEAGLSNSFSLLVAPYMKLPTTGLGFGKIEMNSVGVEFGLKYTPVLRRKRRH